MPTISLPTPEGLREEGLGEPQRAAGASTARL